MIIDISGPIVGNNEKWIYDWFEMQATCPKDVISKLREANGADVEVNINSGGGNVYAGVEIYTALKDYKGNTVGKIVGIAASAASVIGMGVKTLKMSPPAQLMIHKASVCACGNHKQLDHVSEVLQSHDDGICNAYALKTGMKKDKILELMDKETYFGAQEALKLGFVDEIMFDEGLKLSASINGAELSPEVINKLRNLLVKNQEPPEDKYEALTGNGEEVPKGKIEEVQKASAEGAFFIPKNTADPEPDPEPPLENGEELTPQPVSDTALQAQQEYFKNQKLKLMGGITNV
jgi:ATP-dependent Clp protease protease subunit